MNQTDLVQIQTKEGELTQLWAEAFELWMGSLGADATRRSYRASWRDFLGFTNKVPWRIGRSDVARWGSDIMQRGLSPCTLNLKLAAISSFYTYVCTEFTIVSDDGLEVPLHHHNPAAGRSLRAKINPYGKAEALTTEEVIALLSAVPRHTAVGLRDFAMLMAYLFTARRNAEIRNLRWGEIERAGGRYWYTWSGKGKVGQRHELPEPVYLAIVDFLQAAGRRETIRPEEFIFIALAPSAKGGKPISSRQMGRILKKHAGTAGLDQDAIHVHTLRHTAAMLRRAAGDDIQQVSALLSHSSLAITQIYLDRVEGKADASWAKVYSMLGLKRPQEVTNV